MPVPIHPAVPIAAQFLAEHTASIVQVLEHRAELSHATGLARMLQQIITQTTASITEKQIEAILSLTQQTHQALNSNLNHYMREQEKFTSQYLATTDLILRAEMTRHITNIDHQMRAIRRDLQALHRFSAQIITICGDAGLKFVRDLAVPYTAPKLVG
jgi:hypothetical protein